MHSSRLLLSSTYHADMQTWPIERVSPYKPALRPLSSSKVPMPSSTEQRDRYTPKVGEIWIPLVGLIRKCMLM